MKKLFLLISLLVAGTSFGGDGDLGIPTANGGILIKAADAAILESHWHWLDERYAAATAIKVGSTYADLTKHFRIDGGTDSGGSWRFVHDLAPRLKLDVTFEGNFVLGKPDPNLRIKSVSRPYLDEIRAD